MDCRFLYWLFLSILTNVYGEDPSMIRIPGQPGISNSFETLDASWQNCMESCWADINCSILIPQDQCPASNPVIPGPTYYTQIINGQLYKTIVSQDSLSKNIYNLTYSVYTCPNNTKLFQRGETTVVCIGLFFFETPRCNIQAQASALCKAQKDISNSSKYTSNPDSIIWLAYWIDGVSTTDSVSTTGIDGISTTEYYTFEDQTHAGTINYKWTRFNEIISPTHYKQSGYCLYNPGPHNCNVQDDPCSYTLEAHGEVCWRGALCQVPPIIEMY
ncbi:unnamed protein product [Caenorhabditis nigoni]